MTTPTFDDRPGRSASRRFRLDKANGKVLGVSAGIATTYDLDVTMVRLLWAIGALLGFGSLILVYLAIGLLAEG